LHETYQILSIYVREANEFDILHWGAGMIEIRRELRSKNTHGAQGKHFFLHGCRFGSID
jgi:hypothetical protein